MSRLASDVTRKIAVGRSKESLAGCAARVRHGPSPALPTRLMAGLAILNYSYDLSDEALCDRCVENPYLQYFCGEEFFQHVLAFDRCR